MTDDPNLYELILDSADSAKPPQIIRLTGTDPEELMDAAREMSRAEPGGVNSPPYQVRAVVNGIEIARFLGRWLWKIPRSN